MPGVMVALAPMVLAALSAVSGPAWAEPRPITLDEAVRLAQESADGT